MAIKSNRSAVMGELESRLRRANAAGMVTVQNNAKRAAPVDTGRLRSSVTGDSDETGFVVGTNVSYAKFLEGGTRYMRPRPFLVPGLVESIPDLKRVYES